MKRNSWGYITLLLLSACGGNPPAMCEIKYEGGVTNKTEAARSGLPKGDCFALTRQMLLLQATGVSEYLFISEKPESDDHYLGTLALGTHFISEKVGLVTSCDGNGNSGCQTYSATIGNIASGPYTGQRALLPAALEEVTELNGHTHTVYPPVEPCR